MTTSAAEPPTSEPLTTGTTASRSTTSGPATSESTTTDGSHRHPQRGTTEGADRVATLSDGVVAIAMTLLALDLKPDVPLDAPTNVLVDYFADHNGQYISFVVAFALIARYWVMHHAIMRSVRRVDLALIWVNMLFLFATTLVPLTTYLQGAYGNSQLGVIAFGCNLILMMISMAAVQEVIRRHHLEDGGRRTDVFGYTRTASNLLVPVIVIALAPFTGPWVTLLYFLFAIADIPADRLQRHRDRARSARSSPPAA